MAQQPTVYVIDDDEIIRNVLEKILDEAKLPVQSYASAEDFLETYTPPNTQDVYCSML